MTDSMSKPRTEAARAVFDETHGASLGGWVEMSDDDARALYVAIEAEARSAALNEVEAAIAEGVRPLLSWAEAVRQHHAMLRTEPPFTTTAKLRDAIGDVYAAIAHLRQGEPT